VISMTALITITISESSYSGRRQEKPVLLLMLMLAYEPMDLAPRNCSMDARYTVRDLCRRES
jgi:hypothetical protein